MRDADGSAEVCGSGRMRRPTASEVYQRMPRGVWFGLADWIKENNSDLGYCEKDMLLRNSYDYLLNRMKWGDCIRRVVKTPKGRRSEWFILEAVA